MTTALSLTQARDRFVVRLTGGCGNMSADDAGGILSLCRGAFPGFGGALLFGGTRMLRKDDPSVVVPGITEAAPVIQSVCPDAVTLGVVPRTRDLRLAEYGLIVSDEPSNDFVTVVHPEQDECLVIQRSADTGVLWEAELHACLGIIGDLRTYAGWRSLLICYNGGGVTEKEILATAERGWPILLIAGSGRKTDEYVNRVDELRAYTTVYIAEKTSASLRQALVRAGAIPVPTPTVLEPSSVPVRS